MANGDDGCDQFGNCSKIFPKRQLFDESDSYESDDGKDYIGLDLSKKTCEKSADQREENSSQITTIMPQIEITPVIEVTPGIEIKAVKPKQQCCWNCKHPESTQRGRRKLLRNLGLPYVSNSTKKLISARRLGPPCTCKRKCRSLLDGMEEEIFNNFWDLRSFDVQNLYLFSCIHAVPKRRHYPKKTKREISSRRLSVIYTVNIRGTDVTVCKNEFMSVHGLQNSRGRINNIVNQIAEGRTTPKPDARGKHLHHYSKFSTSHIQSVYSETSSE